MPTYTVVQTEIPPCRLELERARAEGLSVRLALLGDECRRVAREATLVDGLLRATLDGLDTRFWVGRLRDGRPPTTPGPANDTPPGGLAVVAA